MRKRETSISLAEVTTASRSPRKWRKTCHLPPPTKARVRMARRAKMARQADQLAKLPRRVARNSVSSRCQCEGDKTTDKLDLSCTVLLASYVLPAEYITKLHCILCQWEYLESLEQKYKI